MMSSETNKQVIRRFSDEVYSQGNLAAIEELVAEDYVEHSGPPQLPSQGREAVRALVTLFRSAFPDLHLQIDDLLTDGDYVTSRNLGMGTHLGEFFGIPATGKAGAMTGIHVYRIVDGKIAEHWSNSDDFGLLVQLGVIPTPENA
jgi:steroid delta-isomerase-like uncharacterized protein